eukprot:scaffold18612_cov118-Isochrysis_galbana.AAC.9
MDSTPLIDMPDAASEAREMTEAVPFETVEAAVPGRGPVVLGRTAAAAPLSASPTAFSLSFRSSFARSPVVGPGMRK